MALSSQISKERKKQDQFYNKTIVLHLITNSKVT